MKTKKSAPKKNIAARIPLGPELQFLQRLWRLNRALALVSSRIERELGITAQQRMLIRCVGRFPSMTAGQLAADLHLDRGTVSNSLARLERRGLVRRARDPKDRRRVTIGLTAEGRVLDHPRGGSVEGAVAEILALGDARALAAAQDLLESLTVRLESLALRGEAPHGKPLSSGRRRH